MSDTEILTYLETLSKRRDAASGGWHMSRDATIDALIAFVRAPSAENEKHLRAAWESLGVAETVRGELLLEHVTHIVARVQTGVLDLQADVHRMHAALTEHQQREEAGITAHADALAHVRADVRAVRALLESLAMERGG